ncbi:MAG: hypothetical protein WC809_20010 [Sinimarinibacterium sp.]|jgi:hypothetical protein
MGFLKSLSRIFVGRAERMPTGYMVWTGPDGTQIHYSPYHELRHQSDDGKLLAQVIVTSGKERVPPGYRHTGPFADDLSEAYKNGILDQVLEVYFSNRSDAAVTVRFLHAEFLDKRVEVDHSIQIPPRNRNITRSVITLGSNSGTHIPVTIAYEYAGKRYDVCGPAKRLTVDELANKRFGESGT